MQSYIYLNDLRFYAFHGVMPQERVTGGEFVVNLRVKFSVNKATETDNVADTLNYADMYAIAKEEMNKPSNLLEHVAGRIGRRIMQEMPGAQEADISVLKVNPPFGAHCGGAGVDIKVNPPFGAHCGGAGVDIHLDREDL